MYISQDDGAMGFVDFTKLSFALSSLAQPFDQMGSISRAHAHAHARCPLSVPSHRPFRYGS